MPWIVRLEQEIRRQLMQDYPREIDPHFEIKGLMRGDMKSRSEFYRSLFNMSAISPNEIRALEDTNPSEDPNMDKYFVQSATIPVDIIDEVALKSGESKNASANVNAA